MPKVSVCMPVYNTNPDHLRQAIESALSQTFKDFEFLILNDSPDNKNLKKIVSEYKDSRIVYLENKKNIGISEARNKLVKISRGEYLAVCDHDDISVPDRFEKQVAILDKNPAIGVVSAQIKWFPNKEVRWQSRNPIKNYDIKTQLMTGCAVLHPVSMIRKSVMIENEVFYENRFS
ncbi:MAG: glycosyltransferase, partial [Alphaproteobacteria bacterium]|nr:glycosyltransferase [Alphaproteobacteria bacterium]